MKKKVIKVPKGIRYLSDWEGFALPENPSIINKQITGCGFTEYCISNDSNMVLISPRRMLLENKKDQHPEYNVFYFKNEFEKVVNYDKDLTSTKPKMVKEPVIVEDVNLLIELKNDLKHQLYQNKISGTPFKILVTYDSFRHVKEVLQNEHMLGDFCIVVDEFQSIFTDSKFKSSTEMELLDQLQDIQRLSFVSATPMIEEYLDMLDEFKDLPYYELDWAAEDPSRVIKPQLEIFSSRSIISDAVKVIESYKNKNFERASYIDDSGKIVEVYSTECIVYVNSVKNICELISRCNLTPNETNVLCAKTEDNEKKVRRALKVTKRTHPDIIGTVPKGGEPHKMFTFCTRTVYLGADFYSTNARSFIFSDANIDCLAVDITLDLPQILGRQRLNENPWKNRAFLYYRNTLDRNVVTRQDFVDKLNKKIDDTNSLLRAYGSVDSKDKHVVAEKFERDTKATNYRFDFVAVDHHKGSDLLPVFNNLVMVSEMRAFDVQQVDYKDRFTLFSSIVKNNTISDFTAKIELAVSEFESIIRVGDKLEYLTRLSLTEEEILVFLDRIPIKFKNYYTVIGPDRFSALRYNVPELEREYQKLINNQDIDISSVIYSNFKEGEKYTKADLKDRLSKIYESAGYKKAPKANDIEEYFEVKTILITNKETKKRDNGFELIKRKEGNLCCTC